MQKWEYRRIEINLGSRRVVGTGGFFGPRAITDDEALAELGDDGWELVGVVGQAIKSQHLYFKRPKQE